MEPAAAQATCFAIGCSFVRAIRATASSLLEVAPMIILLVIALVLAWPTYGLSLLVYVAILLLGAHFRARHRRIGAMVLQATRLLQAGEGIPPSWVSNGIQSSAFIGATIRQAVQNGVPRSFVSTHFSSEVNKAAFLGILGLVESQGASIREQGIVATGLIREAWQAADAELASAWSDLQQILDVGKSRSFLKCVVESGTFDDPDLFHGCSAEMIERMYQCRGIAERICSFTAQEIDEVLLTSAKWANRDYRADLLFK